MGNANGQSRRPLPAEGETLPTKTEELTMADWDPEIIALVSNPELRNLDMLLQAQSNDKVLQEVKSALLQCTPLPRQFQGMRDRLVQKGGILYHQVESSTL